MAPFIRLVREFFDRICDLLRREIFELGRWHLYALACIHEAAKDFIIDFMKDSYIVVVYSHRFTLMSKDFGLVSRFRYRFDKFLKPIPMTYRRAYVGKKPLKLEEQKGKTCI